MIDHIRSLQKKNKKFDMYEMTQMDDDTMSDDDDDDVDTQKKSNDHNMVETELLE